MKTRELTAADVTFGIECLPSDIPIVGNCSAIDEDTDRETAEWITDQLDSGNEWAWCTVKVTASWKSHEGEAYLGGCSYKSEEDFKEPGGYWEQMKEEALDDLNQQLQVLREELEELDQD
jgi:hypothetical protein